MTSTDQHLPHQLLPSKLSTEWTTKFLFTSFPPYDVLPHHRFRYRQRHHSTHHHHQYHYVITAIILILCFSSIPSICATRTIPLNLPFLEPDSKSSNNGDIVVLRWPHASNVVPYTPSSFVTDTLVPSDTSPHVNHHSPPLDTGQYDHDQGHNDYRHSYHHAKEAPLPPHPDYVGQAGKYTDHDDEPLHGILEEDDKVEKDWKEMKKKLRIKPINHDIFKTDGGHKATIPYKPTQPFYELQYAIDQLRRAVYKINPTKALANEAFKKFNNAVKVSCSTMCEP